MPLTGAEKNQIAQLGILSTTQSLTTALGLGALGGSILGALFLPLSLGLSAQFGRVRFPRLSPGDIGRASQAGSAFRISSDPFFGDVVISRPEQAPFLEELVQASAIRRVVATADNSPILLRRRAIIEGLAESAGVRGFESAIDPEVRGGVFRPTADAPLQFIPGDFL